MAFTPKNWRDSPDTGTPISAAALEDLEKRVTDYLPDSVVINSANTVAPTDADTPFIARAKSATQSAPLLQAQQAGGQPLAELTATGTGYAVGQAAGALNLYGANGANGAGNPAWQVAIDVTGVGSTKYRDLAIAKINADGSARDLIYLKNNGANPPQAFINPTGESAANLTAGVSIAGQLNASGDPTLFELVPTDDRNVGVAVLQQRCYGEANPRLQTDVNGRIDWGAGGATAPGGLQGSPGVTLEATTVARFSSSKAGVTPCLVVNNDHPLADGDGARLSLTAEGNEMGRIDAAWNSTQAGGVVTHTVRGPGDTRIDRIKFDKNGIAFNGNSPFVPAAAAPVATDLASVITLANNLRTTIVALGFMTGP